MRNKLSSGIDEEKTPPVGDWTIFARFDSNNSQNESKPGVEDG